jgi:hypothetical protein
MSDIYLQITETPTVVTLSAPVVSGALAATVTVANVVSVNVVTMPSISVQAPSVTTVIGTVTANAGSFQIKNYNNIVTSGYLKQAFDESLQVSGMGDEGAVLSQISSVFGLNLSATTGSLPISGAITIGSAIPAGTNRIGVVTIGGGTVTIGAGTAQIGSVTASISGTVPVSGTFWQATQPVSGTFWQATQPVSLASVPAHAVTLSSTTVTVSSLPALAAGTAQIGSVTASISGTVPVSGTFWQATQPVSLASVPAHAVTLASTTVTVSSMPAISGSVTLGASTAQIGSVTASISGAVNVNANQGFTVNQSNFTSTTDSTSLCSSNANRKVLTIYNEGAGTLYVSAGTTCTSVSYQVKLATGEYWEAPANQTAVAHAAVFSASGVARVTQVQ